MYDELVKRMWECASGECFNCSQYTPTTNASVCQKELMKQAADAIEELSKPKWIPVTERLPEPNAVDKYGFAKGYLVKTDRHVMMHTARYNGEWWILWGRAEVITDTVIYWMPLPELPKGE